MAKKVMISIPAELHERLQTVKDRISISGVCQEALESVIHLQELKMSTQTDENYLERMRAEKEEYDKQYEDQGRKDAMKDVKSMSYRELVEVSEADRLYETDVWHNWLKDQVDEFKKDDSVFNAEAYLKGWEGTVREHFDEIKDQL